MKQKRPIPENKNTKLLVFKVPTKKSLRCKPKDICSKIETTIILSDCTPLDPNIIIISTNKNPKKPLMTVAEVSEEANKQRDTLNPASKIIPKYDPSSGPQSKIETKLVTKGNKKATKIIVIIISQTAKNLPSTISREEIGEVKSRSMVLSFFSSEIIFIAISGIKIKNVMYTQFK